MTSEDYRLSLVQEREDEPCVPVDVSVRDEEYADWRRDERV